MATTRMLCSRVARSVGVGAAVGLLVFVAKAQARFSPLEKNGLPPRTYGESTAVAAGDVDSDGDLDLVFANGYSPWPVTLLLNDGRAGFEDVTFTRVPATGTSGRDIVLTDTDGDGDLDVIVASDFRPTYYLNDGTGRFSNAWYALPLDPTGATLVAAGDVDLDGDVDLLFAGRNGPLELMLNDGTGVFVPGGGTGLPPYRETTTDLVLADIDGDGDEDAVLAGGPRPIVLENVGGAFAVAIPPRFPATELDCLALAAGDLDGDLDLDVIVTLTSPSPSAPPKNLGIVFLNVGGGYFVQGPGFDVGRGEPSVAVGLADSDRDGDLDAALASRYGAPALLTNDGRGRFTPAVGAVPAIGQIGTDVAIADLDGDDYPDLVFANYALMRARSANLLFANDGNGRFFEVHGPRRLPVLPDAARAQALADTDGDGDLDVALGFWSGTEGVRLYENDGSATFELADALPMVQHPLDLEFADVDADGDPDLVVANQPSGYPHPYDGQNQLLLNDQGRLVAAGSRLPPDQDVSDDVAVADVDGDADLDLFFANRHTPSRLYLNDGRGTFQDAPATSLPVINSRIGRVEFGDFDGDGDPDLVGLAEQSGQQVILLLINDGQGRFSVPPAGPPGVQGGIASIELADVDRDGDVDLVLAGHGDRISGTQLTSAWLLLNDGRGSFMDATATRMPLIDRWVTAVGIGDFDRDGDPDLFVGFRQGTVARESSVLLLNDGSGRFEAAAPPLVALRHESYGVDVADLDDDGDPDLVLMDVLDPAVYLNRHRQVHAPSIAHAGRSYVLEVHARPGYARLFQIAVLGVSLQRTRVPVPPFGTFGLDPATLIDLGPSYLPPPGGVVSRTFTLPNDPGLVGTRFYSQALVMDPDGETHLTNVQVDRVR